MKKITLLAVLLVASVTMNAQTTITHSTSMAIDAGTTVACPTEPTQYLRMFNLEADFSITADWEVSEVNFGVEVSETADITMNLYAADGDDPTTATLDLIYTATVPTVDGMLSNHVVPAGSGAIVPSGMVLAFELSEAEDGTVFRIGSNAAGQTAPSWLRSLTCGEGTVESFGFTNHYVVDVTGDEILAVGDNLADLVSIFPNPATDVLNINVPSNVEVKSTVLFDVLGKDTGVRVSNGQMDIASLATGVYILNIESNAGTLTQKVVKK